MFLKLASAFTIRLLIPVCFFYTHIAHKAFPPPPSSDRATLELAPTSTCCFTSISSRLHIGLYFPSIQWLITLLHQTTKATFHWNHNWTSLQHNINRSTQHLRIFVTLQQQQHQLPHIYHLTLQRQLRIQIWGKLHQWKNQLCQSARQSVRRPIKPAQSRFLQNPDRESWVFPRPSARYVRSSLLCLPIFSLS